MGRVAVLTDTDSRGGTPFTAPAWITDRDASVVQGFFSSPTLEPSIAAGNEEAVTVALERLGITPPVPVTADSVDDIFRGTGRKRKAEFSLEIAAELARRLTASEPVAVPIHFREMFEFLYMDPDGPGADPATADT